MINTGEFRNLIREIVRDEIGDKSLYKIGEVASIGDKVTVIFSGEAEPSQKQYTYLKSYSPGLGDRVILMKDKGTYVVLGKIGERGGGITFGEHLAENAQKHITESGENTNGRYVKFDDGTQICWFQAILNFTISSPYGSLYLGSVNVWYPKTFVGIPNVCVGSCRHGTGASWGTAYDIKSTYFMMRVIDVTARTDQNLDYGYVAIGRWK